MILKHSQENSRKMQRTCHGRSQEKSFQQDYGRLREDVAGSNGMGSGDSCPGQVRTGERTKVGAAEGHGWGQEEMSGQVCTLPGRLCQLGMA